MRRERCAMYMRSLLLFWGLTTLAVGNALAGGPNLGRPIDPADIAAWNIDVEPDGAGLPAGSGIDVAGACTFLFRRALGPSRGGVGGEVVVGGRPPQRQHGWRTAMAG